ncbi:hypothetical protein [Blastococcus sp. CCUG 61487]|nr:hypothetical protein [Blastococcus sp. CCUG 61487]
MTDLLLQFGALAIAYWVVVRGVEWVYWRSLGRRPPRPGDGLDRS